MTNETIDNASSRKAARANGLRFYAGTPCPSHPAALRYVASKACVECAKAARKRNVDTEKDKLRKRAARSRTAMLETSVLCDVLGI